MQRGHPSGDDSASETAHRRGVRSFVLRGGRITDAQQRALAELWPRYGIDYRPGPLDLDAIFGRHAPRICEIGFGNGEHLAALAAAHPDRDHLGIEVHRPGVGRLLLALAQLDIGNVRVVCEDAVQVLEQQIPPEALDEVLILFPDPWPKKRHHKRRLIQPAFVRLVGSRLAPGGVLRLATDWQPYAEQMLEVLSASTAFRNASPQGSFAPRPSERAATRFERRGERLGHGVWDLVFEKRA